MHAACNIINFKAIALWFTLTVRWCILDGWHLTLLVLQQPVQRFTSTQGGHIRKFADVGSIWLRGISYITVLVLHTAGTASSMKRKDHK